MKRMIKAGRLVLSLALAVTVFSGCQAVFTTSWMGDVFKPDAADIPPERLSEYCWDILANGTPAEKASAYAALKVALTGENADDPEMNYVAGTMALDQAGLSLNTITDVLADPASINTLLTDLQSSSETAEIAGFMSVAYAGGAEMTSADLVFGGLFDLLEEEGTTTDIMANVDFVTPAPQHETAVEMISSGAEPLLELFSDSVTDLSELMDLFL